MVGIALLVFPKLALGLSGFETGVAVMPQIAGDAGEPEDHPAGRIRGTRRLLTTAAVIMSVFLITSSIITTVLIPQTEFQQGGQANGRALAYLAHEYLGNALRQRVRHLDDHHPVVRRRVRDGRAAEPGPPLPAALRHGPGMGQGGPPAGAGVRRRSPSPSPGSSTPTSTRRAARTPPACWC